MSDESGNDIGTVNSPTDGVDSGQFNPEDVALLSAFDGQDASGRWTLTIVDYSSGDTGTIFDWTLFFSV